MYKDYVSAEAEFRASIRARPSASAHCHLADLLADRRKHAAAEREYRNALKIDPDDADVHMNLGVLFERRREHEAARREFRAALRLEPGHEHARKALDELALRR